MKNVIRRGVIEGFYGHPWSPRQRERMIDLLAQWKLDTFLCSPKDQPNHRIYWQEPFSELALAQIKSLVDRGKGVGVDVGTSLSPGLTLEYSNPQHLDSQMHRLSQLNSIGCSLVGIFLDDIPGDLQTDGDKKMFSTIIDAQLYFTNTLYERARSQGITMEFIVCPTQYCGIGNEEYISTFGTGLNADLKLMWTGRQICSPRPTSSPRCSTSTSADRSLQPGSVCPPYCAGPSPAKGGSWPWRRPRQPAGCRSWPPTARRRPA